MRKNSCVRFTLERLFPSRIVHELVSYTSLQHFNLDHIDTEQRYRLLITCLITLWKTNYTLQDARIHISYKLHKSNQKLNINILNEYANNILMILTFCYTYVLFRVIQIHLNKCWTARLIGVTKTFGFNVPQN